MKPTIKKVWKLLGVVVEELKKKNSEIALNENAYDDFDKAFRKLHKDIKNEYMDIEVKNLDRHKIAGIIIVSVIRSKAVEFKGDIAYGSQFIGQYLAAASTGISYMQDCLNKQLIKNDKDIIKELWFPDALSCDTPYFEILCRNLYYADNNTEWGLNPLEIAEKLFLIEYVTVEKNGIDPHILKEVSS